MDQAAAPAARAGLEHHHQPAAAHGDGLLRQLVLVAGDELAEVPVDLLAHAADLPAQGGEPGAGVLPHLAPAVEGALDLPEQGVDVGEPAGQRVERRAGGPPRGCAPPPPRVALPRSASRTRSTPSTGGRPVAMRVEEVAQGDVEVGHQRPLARPAGRPPRRGSAARAAPPPPRTAAARGPAPAQVARRETRDHRQEAGEFQRLRGGLGEDGRRGKRRFAHQRSLTRPEPSESVPAAGFTYAPPPPSSPTVAWPDSTSLAEAHQRRRDPLGGVPGAGRWGACPGSAGRISARAPRRVIEDREVEQDGRGLGPHPSPRNLQ